MLRVFDMLCVIKIHRENAGFNIQQETLPIALDKVFREKNQAESGFAISHPAQLQDLFKQLVCECSRASCCFRCETVSR